jgi:hypothetical protein
MAASSNFYSELVVDPATATMLDGNAFRWFDFGTIANGGFKRYLIDIPATPVEFWLHGRVFSAGNSTLTLNVFSNPTLSNEGSALPNRILNRNGYSTIESDTIIKQNPTASNNGLLIDHDRSFASPGQGNKGSNGSAASQDFPRLIAPSSRVLVVIENIGGAIAQFDYKLYWSETGG